ncbi:hypothetical protein GFY24_19520 [Nocardia sp. SYP-A9097]|uniref:hypothetical protein n=1 Tax=Nocardia sp. SYP-A9097 TaxID=2663237 RepID=UPI00129A10E8|nr:hypothetical protein [Nocardia sp. SYP-A9097]MRH89606.1 hypothetical protein [Nocardia sp. SYP-A9097]
MAHQTTLLFVHGTGVRGQKYEKTLRSIESRVAARSWPVSVAGCHWGLSTGVTLRNPRSIPTYTDSKGGLSPEQEWLDLWAVLYTDPWYEMRLLQDFDEQPEPVVPGEDPPAQVLRDRIDHFQPADKLAADLAELGLTEKFDSALTQLRTAPEFESAVATAPTDPLEHRAAIARALIARMIADTSADEAPPLGGVVRDALTAQLTTDLDGSGLGISDKLAGLRTKFISHLVTRKLVGERGGLTDAAAPLAGDILRYLARGQRMREFLHRTIADVESDSIVLLGHSLGGIMCVDLLAGEHIPRVRALVTVGSQAPFLYEIGALPSLEPPHTLPAHFPPWVNIYDHRDLLSYTGSGVFDGRVVDIRVDNGEPFVASHSAYWSNDAVWESIGAVLPK